MRMARVNVYLPDQLADAARNAGLNISNLTQEAVRRELESQGASRWVASVAGLPRIRIGHEEVLDAIDAARRDLGDGGE